MGFAVFDFFIFCICRCFFVSFLFRSRLVLAKNEVLQYELYGTNQKTNEPNEEDTDAGDFDGGPELLTAWFLRNLENAGTLLKKAFRLCKPILQVQYE